MLSNVNNDSLQRKEYCEADLTDSCIAAATLLAAIRFGVTSECDVM
jgi:hypothetical protein